MKKVLWIEIAVLINSFDYFSLVIVAVINNFLIFTFFILVLFEVLIEIVLMWEEVPDMVFYAFNSIASLKESWQAATKQTCYGFIFIDNTSRPGLETR